MSERKYMAAMDVGGTKIIAVIFDDAGNILARVNDAGITPVDAPLEKCLERFESVTSRLEALREGRHISAYYCSIATSEHYHKAMYDAIRAVSSADVLRVEPDGMCLISGMLGHNDGAALICGTGSSLYIRENDNWSRVGGWGHYMDSVGSGFVLGRKGMKAVLFNHDGRREPTMMTELMNKQCGRPLWEDYSRIYSLGRSYVASYAHCVIEAFRAGDKVATEIVDKCTSDLAQLVWIAYQKIGRPYTLIFNGGIFSHNPDYSEMVKRKSPPEVNIIFGDAQPIYGCAVEAMHDVGLDVNKEFKNNFTKGID